MHFNLFVCVHVVEKKVQKIKAQSDYLSDSKSSEDEVNPHLRTSQEERVYGTIKRSIQATQAVLSHTTMQCSWRKAVDLVAQETQDNWQIQAAAMAESNQLESLQLCALSVDDSSLPQMTYGSEQPFTTSTPRATLTSIPEMQTTETYRQIIPGMSNHLYPTLVADGSLHTPVADNYSMLQNPITSEVDKLQSSFACFFSGCA